METISIREAAERLGVSAKVVRRLISQGLVQAEKGRGRYGEEWRVDPASLPDALPDHAADSGLRNASQPTPADPPPALPVNNGAWERERDTLTRDKEFLQEQVESLSALLVQALSVVSAGSGAVSVVPPPSEPNAPQAFPAASPLPSLPAVTAALQSSLRLVDPAEIAVIEMCSVRVLWGRPVLWRLLARMEEDLSALREAILSPQSEWDAPGEEVVFLFMRDVDGNTVWGCACGPRWFGAPFEEALRAARVERV